MIQRIVLAFILVAALAWTFRRILNGIRASESDPGPSPACRGCPFEDRCTTTNEEDCPS